MSAFVGELVNPATAERRASYRGWNWPAFFIGPLWYLAHGMIGYGLLTCAIYLLLGSRVHLVLALLFGHVLIPSYANKQLREWLWRRGWHPATEVAGANATRDRSIDAYRLPHDSS